MGFSYRIGLSALVPPEAPALNANAVEDLGFQIQSQLSVDDFSAREIFAPGVPLLGAESRADRPTPLVYVWRGAAEAGEDPSPPPALLADLAAIERAGGSVPYDTSLPDPLADILVPRWPAPSAAAPAWKQLHACVTPLEGAEAFLGGPAKLGSLDVTLRSLEEWRESIATSASTKAVYDALIAAMRLAKKHDLFFTFQL